MAEGTACRLDLVDLAIECGWDVEGTKSAEEFSRDGVTVLVQYALNDQISTIARYREGRADEFFGSDLPGQHERLKLWLTDRLSGSPGNVTTASRVKVKKLRWNPGKGRDFLRRADGAEYSIATGHRGTYEWVIKDGLHAAYHYPGGFHTETPIVLVAPQGSWQRAYRACVDHNKAQP